MATNWTDPTLSTSTHVRTLHMNELYSVIDQNRQAVGMAGYSWSNMPILTTTHVRAVHFTNARNAIQDLWNHAGMGTLPNWSVGGPPTTSRQVSAHDMTDLRNWIQQYENTTGVSYQPTYQSSVGGVTTTQAALNGLHWQSPVTVDSIGSRRQINLGAGFGATLVLSPKDSSGSNWNGSGNPDPSATNIYWLETGRTSCNVGATFGVPFWEIVIVRLLHDQGSLPGFPNDPGQLAALWGPFIRWCQGQNVFNFVVLNEPDQEYPNLLWTPGQSGQPGSVSSDAQNYMAGLADAIRAQGTVSSYGSVSPARAPRRTPICGRAPLTGAPTGPDTSR